MTDDVYQAPTNLKGARLRFAAVLRQAKGLIGVEHVMTALSMDRKSAAKTLARWYAQGRLQRVGHGLYAAIPLEAQATGQALEDPWILVPSLFGSAYIGGWTAAEHWDLTEQLFRDIFVFTTKNIRAKKHNVHGIAFLLRHIQPEALFGTKSLWRGQIKVQISDVHRTVIDMLADPSTGGGIRHVADCFTAYFKHSDASPELLIQYAEKLGNGAVFKRMGFLAETLPDAPERHVLVEACRRRLTQGNAKLDPGLDCLRLVRAWRLWIPKTWVAASAAAKERRS
jgi:predicted transcriptional regulator of viral defense system